MNKILQRFLPTKKSFLGLDIGDSTIKAVELKKTKDNYQVVKAGKIDTPSGAVDDGKIVNPEALSAALEKLMSKHKFETKDVVIIVNGSNVITRQVPMPVMENKDIVAALKYEAERYIPIPVEDLIIDHIIIGQEEGEEGPQYNLLLVAVPQQIIFQYYDLLVGVGLTPIAVEIVPVTLWRLFNHYNRSELASTDSAFAVIDIGTKISNLVVFVKDHLVYTRTIPVGGAQITDSVAQTFMLSFEDAEDYKMKHGLIIVDDNVSVIHESFDSNSIQLDLAIRSGVVELIHEIQRSLDFFKLNFKASGQESDKVINKIYFLGGTTKIQGIMELLEAEIGIPVDKLDSSFFEKESVVSFRDKLDSEFTIALGLALREVID